MKQSKFSLADVLTVLTALVFGFICFLGKNFSTLGNIYASIAWAAFITLSLAGTAYIAKLLKRTSRNFRTNFILEIVVLFLFTCLTVYFAYFSFPHYFNISENKNEIQNKLKASIIQAENMFADYESYVQTREAIFKSTLDATVAVGNPSELTKYDFKAPDLVPYKAQIAHKMSMLHSDLIPPNYSDTVNMNGIKDVATVWLAKAKDQTDNWKPIGVVSVVNNIEKNSNDWLNKLVGFSQQVNLKGEQNSPFVHLLNSEDVKKYFTTKGKPTLLSIVLAVIAYLIMLLSYLISKRSTKDPGRLVKQRGVYDIDF